MDDGHISRDEVEHIARLARLALTPEELTSIHRDLGSILDYIDQLAELDLEGVEPTTTVSAPHLRTRADEVVATLSRDDVLANAPASRDGCFAVPRTVEGGN